MDKIKRILYDFFLDALPYVLMVLAGIAILAIVLIAIALILSVFLGPFAIVSYAALEIAKLVLGKGI